MRKWYSFSGHTSQGAGWFQFFNIYDWWQKTFTEQEKNYILENYTPMGGSSDDLIRGDFSTTKRGSSGINLLTGIVGYFDNKKDRQLAYRFIRKAEDMVTPQTSIQDLHFFYTVKLQTYFKDRVNGEEYLNTAIQACQKLIALAPVAAEHFKKEWGVPPAHLGFKQMVILHEKDKEYEKAISLCQRAQEQGWNGDWNKRIERIKRKQVKNV